MDANAHHLRCAENSEPAPPKTMKRTGPRPHQPHTPDTSNHRVPNIPLRRIKSRTKYILVGTAPRSWCYASFCQVFNWFMVLQFFDTLFER